MNRIDQMKEMLDGKKNSLINNRVREMEKAYLNNESNIKANLEEDLKKLTSHSKDGKLVIAYLRSSYIVNSYEFYVAYYRGEVFVEEEPACVYFSMRPLFFEVEKDIKEIIKYLHEKFIRVLSAEKEEICRWYIEHIYSRFIYVMESAVNCIEIRVGIDIFYGGYMDNLEFIGRI